MTDGIDIAISLLQSVGYGCPYECGKGCVEGKSDTDGILCMWNGKRCWKKYIEMEAKKNEQ